MFRISRDFFLYWSRKIIVSFLLFILLMQLIAPARFSAGAFEVDIGLYLGDKGQTVIHFPPMGKITADTHNPPFDLHLSLENIKLDKLTTYVSTTSPGSWLDVVQEDFRKGIIRFFFSLLLIAFFVGIAVSLLWSRPKIKTKEMAILGLTNCFLLVFLLLPMGFSYNRDAFSSAEYEGILEAAPWVMGVLDEGNEVIKDLGTQLGEIAENISTLHLQMEKEVQFKTEKDCVTVLHVSDIHNNPASFQFIKLMAQTFAIDLIIDTGDMVDYGTGLEMELMAGFFDSLETPYLFIPGNHESPASLAQLETSTQITVLKEGIVEAAGLKIAGIADPSSYSTAMKVADVSTLDLYAQRLQQVVKESEGVDIIAAHNPALFSYLRKEGHLLLGGHLHTPYIRKEEDYIEINAGTTGASGLRGLQNMEMDFSLVLLNLCYDSEAESFFPHSAELIRVKQLPLRYSFERFVF